MITKDYIKTEDGVSNDLLERYDYSEQDFLNFVQGKSNNKENSSNLTNNENDKEIDDFLN